MPGFDPPQRLLPCGSGLDESNPTAVGRYPPAAGSNLSRVGVSPPAAVPHFPRQKKSPNLSLQEDPSVTSAGANKLSRSEFGAHDAGAQSPIPVSGFQGPTVFQYRYLEK